MALLTRINGIPLYSTVNEALAYAEAESLQGYHTHKYKNIVGYMGGVTHEKSRQSSGNISIQQQQQIITQQQLPQNIQTTSSYTATNIDTSVPINPIAPVNPVAPVLPRGAYEINDSQGEAVEVTTGTRRTTSRPSRRPPSVRPRVIISDNEAAYVSTRYP